jgi:two-component system chemotaxis response regulator CheB
VLLTGSDDDGSAGMGTIRRRGGITLVQDPDESAFPEMPAKALQYGVVDHRLSLAAMPNCLNRMVRQEIQTTMPEEVNPGIGPSAAYSCPDCGGGMVENRNGDLLQFRCRVGHVLSPESMLQAEDDSVERALWAALRALEDSAAVLRRIAAEPYTKSPARDYYEKRAQEKEKHASVIRGVLEGL